MWILPGHRPSEDDATAPNHGLEMVNLNRRSLAFGPGISFRIVNIDRLNPTSA